MNLRCHGIYALRVCKGLHIVGVLHGSTMRSKTSTLSSTVERSHRRMVAGTLALSVILLYSLAVTAFSNASNAKMFSFGWSNRVLGTVERDGVVNLYRDNRDTSKAKLDSMLKQAMSMAMCKPVLFGGSIQWEQQRVSPACNCIRNTHVEYVKAVNPGGVPIPMNAMNSDQNKLNTLWISNRLKTECFQNLRHTQARLLF